MTNFDSVVPQSISKILIPYDDALTIEPAYRSALSVAQSSAAELVLLCVQDKPAVQIKDAQDRYSTLRGLQAKLQQCPVPCKIESAYGSVVDCVLQYTHDHAVDMIVMPVARVEEADKVCSESFVQRVQKIAQCETVIVEQI